VVSVTVRKLIACPLHEKAAPKGGLVKGAG